MPIKESFEKFDEVFSLVVIVCRGFADNDLLGNLHLDNIFVYVVGVASDPYRALVDKASDAFYKLTNTITFPKLDLDNDFEQKNEFAKAVEKEVNWEDNVYVNVVASVQYRALVYKESNAFSKLSNTSPKSSPMLFMFNLDDDFEQKNKISKAIEGELERQYPACDFEIFQTLIANMEPDDCMKTTMNEINAVGFSTERHGQAIVGFGTTAKNVDMVPLTRFFYMMKKIGAASKSSAVFIRHGPGVVREFLVLLLR
ncbi:hypersensitive-induced response protein 1 [Artemisia annua]|uniref:Hypersensitive-induced response protein 1 n=1 Tax=Artemisia annua TaxID=35608 RepID=A0A2U1L761_ARTAN|nr:hypersensitive-induced response protein 1 [Artemisia annua]